MHLLKASEIRSGVGKAGFVLTAFAPRSPVTGISNCKSISLDMSMVRFDVEGVGDAAAMLEGEVGGKVWENVRLLKIDSA